MANLCLTTACNRSCAYCFAGVVRGWETGRMSVPAFETALEFLTRSGIGEARLLGGEPTLHPEFPRLAELAVQRGLRVLVFSNGVMPEPALRWIEGQPPDRVTVAINMTAGDAAPDAVLARLGERAALGFNIHTASFDPGFLLETIALHGLSRSIRFGLAHPAAGGHNRFLHPRQYPAVGLRLAAFLTTALAAGVKPSFDCGFVPCMFPPEFLEELGPASAAIGTSCSPVLDVLPDLRVVSCFPLAALGSEALPDGETAAALRARFTAGLTGYRRLGVYRECAACAARESGQCVGGCQAASLQRLRRAESEVGNRDRTFATIL